MSSMNTKLKGDLAVIEAMRYFTNLGHQVLLPIGDRQKYDLVVDDSIRLIKIQCKFTTQKMGSGRYAVKIFIGGGNRSAGSTKIPCKIGDFDFLFAVNENMEMFIIPIDECLKRKTMIALSDEFKVSFIGANTQLAKE